MDVSIIVAHYNTPDFTKNCIASIIEQTVGINYELIVVDNASTIHNSEELKMQFPIIKLVKSVTNLGFAGGNNLGIQMAKGDYILLLNSDTILLNDAISLAFNYIVNKKHIGVVSAQLQFPDGRIQSAAQRFPSIKYLLIEFFRIQKFMTKEKRGKLLLGSFFDHRSIANADWVWGTFFMFQRGLLQKLPSNKLDDRFFMYAEDMQWCFDFKKLGFEIHYYPKAKLIHFMGGSSGEKSELMKVNNELFLKNNFSPLKVKLIQILQNALARNEN